MFETSEVCLKRVNRSACWCLIGGAMGRFRVQRNWLPPLLVGVVPLVAVWVFAGVLAERGRLSAFGGETVPTEGIISLAVLILAILASSGFLTLWQLGDEPINCLALSSGVLLLASIETSLMLGRLTGIGPRHDNGEMVLAAVPILAFSIGLSMVSWQSLRALKGAYFFSEVHLRPQIIIAFGGGLLFFLLRLTAGRWVVGSSGDGFIFLVICLVGALGYGVTWWRYGGTMDAYLCVAMLLMAQAGLAGVIVEGPTSSGLLLATTFRFQSLLCVIVGVTLELRQQVKRARARLLEAIDRAAELEAELRADAEKRREEDHELRSALVVLNGGVQLLMQHAGELGGCAEAYEALDYLQIGASTLSEIVYPDEPELIAFEVKSVIAKELAALSSRGVKSKLIAEKGESMVVGDPLALSRAVRLILDNAERHAPGATVSVAVSSADFNLTISIQDDGPGILPGELEAIFERGRRGSGALDHGEGLGLAIARELANKNGWRIFAEVNSGHGGCFVIEIPMPVRSLA